MIIGGFEQIIAALIMLGLATLVARQQKKTGLDDWLFLSRFFQFVGIAWLVGLAIYVCFFL